MVLLCANLLTGSQICDATYHVLSNFMEVCQALLALKLPVGSMLEVCRAFSTLTVEHAEKIVDCCSWPLYLAGQGAGAILFIPDGCICLEFSLNSKPGIGLRMMATASATSTDQEQLHALLKSWDTESADFKGLGLFLRRL